MSTSSRSNRVDACRIQCRLRPTWHWQVPDSCPSSVASKTGPVDVNGSGAGMCWLTIFSLAEAVISSRTAKRTVIADRHWAPLGLPFSR